MDIKEINIEYKRIGKLDFLGIFEEIENVRQLTFEILLKAALMPEGENKDNLLSSGTNLSKVLSFYDNTSFDEDEGIKGESRINYSLFNKLSEQIGAIQAISGDYGDYVHLRYHGSIDEELTKGHTSDAHLNNTKKENQFDVAKLFEIAEVDKIDFKKLNEAYLSNLWEKEQETWENSHIMPELIFLQRIHRNLSIDINLFGQQIAFVIFEEWIRGIKDASDMDSKEILEMLLEMPCIIISKEMIGSCIDAIDTFLKPENHSKKGVDILVMELQSGKKYDLASNIDDDERDIQSDYYNRLNRIFSFIGQAWSMEEKILNLRYEHKENLEGLLV